MDPGSVLVAVYEVLRQRLDKPLRSVVKAIELTGSPEELPDLLTQAVDEIERMELLRYCPYIASYLDDGIFPRLACGADPPSWTS